MTTTKTGATGDVGHQGEQRLLLFSTVSAGVFAVMAILWGWLADSQIIVLDGVYALIGVLLGGLSLRAAVLVERGPTTLFPFGREALIPAVVGVQGLVLLGSLGYAALDALQVIVTGGSDTALGAALGYAVASSAVSVVVWRVLLRGSGSSGLVAAEAAAWLAGLLLSLGMFVGFLLAILLDGTEAEAVVPYIDPGMVIVAAVAIAPTPLRMLRQTYRELLEGAATPEVAGPVGGAVAQVSQEFGLPVPTVRISKLGRKVYVEVDYLVAEGEWSIGDADKVRGILLERLREPGRTLWITVGLHVDAQWDAV